MRRNLGLTPLLLTLPALSCATTRGNVTFPSDDRYMVDFCEHDGVPTPAGERSCQRLADYAASRDPHVALDYYERAMKEDFRGYLDGHEFFLNFLAGPQAAQLSADDFSEALRLAETFCTDGATQVNSSVSQDAYLADAMDKACSTVALLLRARSHDDPSVLDHAQQLLLTSCVGNPCAYRSCREYERMAGVKVGPGWARFQDSALAPTKQQECQTIAASSHERRTKLMADQYRMICEGSDEHVQDAAEVDCSGSAPPEPTIGAAIFRGISEGLARGDQSTAQPGSIVEAGTSANAQPDADPQLDEQGKSEQPTDSEPAPRKPDRPQPQTDRTVQAGQASGRSAAETSTATLGASSECRDVTAMMQVTGSSTNSPDWSSGSGPDRHLRAVATLANRTSAAVSCLVGGTRHGRPNWGPEGSGVLLNNIAAGGTWRNAGDFAHADGVRYVCWQVLGDYATNEFKCSDRGYDAMGIRHN